MKDLAGLSVQYFAGKLPNLGFLQHLNGPAYRDWALTSDYKNVNCSRRKSRQP